VDIAERPPRRRAPDERRDQLLDAAEQVLTSRGLASTTVADVAEAAGLAKGTMYLYFESKDALLAGLRTRYLARLAETVDCESLSGPTPPPERLMRFVDGMFAWCETNRSLHHLLFHEAGFSEDDVFIEPRRMLTDAIADGVAGGDFHDVDPAITADFLVHGLHGLLVRSLDQPSADRIAIVGAARELTLRSVGRTI
jgi:AcrR family transcriptional regulator